MVPHHPILGYPDTTMQQKRSHYVRNDSNSSILLLKKIMSLNVKMWLRFDSKGETGETTSTRLKGFAFLTPEGGLDQWSLDRIEINNQVIDFKSGSVVTPTSKQ